MLYRTYYLRNRSGEPMDPLSDVLSLLKLQSVLSGGFEAGGEWSIQFAENRGIKCYAVDSGCCWLSVEGVSDPVRLETGDCFILPSGRPFRLASDMMLTPIDAATIYPTWRNGIISCNGGGEFFLVGSYFSLIGNHAGILSGLLPPIVHIRDESEKAALRWCVERMRQELRSPQPGGSLIAQQLATMMLIQALRLHLAEGWLASGGIRLGRSPDGGGIAAMHGEPA